MSLLQVAVMITLMQVRMMMLSWQAWATIWSKVALETIKSMVVWVMTVCLVMTRLVWLQEGMNIPMLIRSLVVKVPILFMAVLATT